MKKIILAVLICCSAGLQAQYKTPFFNTITVDDGLPEANIQSYLEDKYGYLWFGTNNGLVRYDGYGLKPYPILNQEGLPVNPATINYLFEDSKGKIWAFVFLEGLYFYDRSKDIFIKSSVSMDDAAIFKKIKPTYLKEDKKRNSIWMTFFDPEREKGVLYSFDLGSNKLETYNSLAKGNHFIPSYRTVNLSMDAAGKTWLVTDSLLSYFEPATKSFKPFFVFPDTSGMSYFFSVLADPVDADMLWLNISGNKPNEPESKYVRKLLQLNTKTKVYKISAPASKDPLAIPDICFHTFIDSLKRVWVSTDKGISLYNRQTGGFIHYPISYQDTLNHTEVITADKEGNIWLAGNTGRLFFLDTKKAISYLIKSNDGPGSLPAYRVVSNLFFDRSGTLWVNMPLAGIAWRHRQKTQFRPLPVYPFPTVNDVKEMPPQFSIVGSQGDSICYLTDTSSLIAWNTVKNSFEKIDLKEKQHYKSIVAVTKSNDGSLWIAGIEDGLLQYNPVSHTTIEFRNDPKDSTSIASNTVLTVAAGKDGIIWIGTDNKGLNSYNPQTKKFTRYPFVTNNGTKQVKDSLDDKVATCLYFDKDEMLWIGTGSGAVNSFNSHTGKFRSYLNFKEGFFSINSIFEDSHKRLWAATYLSGVYLMDKQTGALKRFSEKEGLIHNSVYSVNEDAAGNIWAATTKGMSRINPVTNSITNFAAARPVMYEFLSNNFLDRNGIFHLPARNGILAFNPLELDESKTLPSVYIESVGYRSSGKANDTLLFTEGLEKIKLKYNENRISFQYIALHFADPLLNQYAYQLEGYDKDWIQAGTQRSVTYTNLSPGKYIFKVKAANSDGVWNETGAIITVIISPPWWKTWWAYTLYALIFLGALRAFSKFRERRLRHEKETLELKVNHRTKQLQESIETLKTTQTQLVQSEKMASLGELTAGIAHEIQNPLNFVNNFSEVNKELLAELNEEIVKGNYDEVKSIAKDVTENEEKIIFHGKRADAIVKGMLQHSRSSSGVKEPTNINALCDEYLRLSYHGLRAKDKSFNATMKTDFDNSIGNLNIIPQDIGRVVLNLITNAFYAASLPHDLSAVAEVVATNPQVKHEPTVWVSTKKEGNKVLISVRDNGPGIPQKVLDKIFQPFFTTKPTGQGTGLGLSLSYDIVKSHGGEIKVVTKENDGTTFIIHLPAAK
ncbi:MAG: two-component regulator propeller domain-containing protein [Ferruginibacter sp.]